MRSTYVWRAGRFINKSTGEPMEAPDRLAMPMIVSDIEPYASPINGRMITSRSERRDDLARNGCVPYEPMGNMPKGLKNVRFAKKHGMEHMLTEEARDAHKIASRKS